MARRGRDEGSLAAGMSPPGEATGPVLPATVGRMGRARDAFKRMLPGRVVNRYRRRRVTRAYLEALSWELLERETRLDYLEGRVAARRDGFYERMVGDVLERTEIIL